MVERKSAIIELRKLSYNLKKEFFIHSSYIAELLLVLTSFFEEFFLFGV